MILDDLNRQIVLMLQKDGRLSNSEIARRLGVTETTVRRRIDRMVEDGIIRVAAVANPFKIGLQTVALISIDVDLPKLEDVARALVAMKEVRYVGYATGAHDIVIEAIFPDNAALLKFVSERLGRIPGIRRTETSIQLDVLKRSYEWEIPALRAEATDRRQVPRRRIAPTRRRAQDRAGADTGRPEPELPIRAHQEEV